MNLTRYKPEIVETAFSGNKQAVMTQCNDGAWRHYKEVEKLLAEKDKEITQLKKVIFQPIKIGEQEWSTKNLNLTDEGLGKDHWKDEKSEEVYYSWKAAMRIAKKISGYHIPTVEDWDELIQTCGGICRNPKESLWRDFNCEKVKEILKIELVGEYFDGFYGEMRYATFWTGTEYCQSESWVKMFYPSPYIESSKLFKEIGFSVRLVKDK